MFPDGGIARFRAFGLVNRDFSHLPRSILINLAAVENGARALSFSDAHYGNPSNLLMPGRGKGMYDGWETARNPFRPPVFLVGQDGHLIIPGSHNCIIKLAARGVVLSGEIDTAHFKGNFPESFILEGCDQANDELESTEWKILYPRTRLAADNQFLFTLDTPSIPFTHVKVTILPDGGLSRVRIHGRIAQ